MTENPVDRNKRQSVDQRVAEELERLVSEQPAPSLADIMAIERRLEAEPRHEGWTARLRSALSEEAQALGLMAVAAGATLGVWAGLEPIVAISVLVLGGATWLDRHAVLRGDDQE